MFNPTVIIAVKTFETWKIDPPYLSGRAQCTHGKINIPLVHSNIQEVCGRSRIVAAPVLTFAWGKKAVLIS